ncbi:MAG: GNAT family N-acetyltransferase, partial [Coriobacteriaceae bacterium]|nr:GNAT family N-acetyltransferase [Coriobacteriaceae bacterium]
DRNGQALDDDGEPIPGLYAAGEVAGGVVVRVEGDRGDLELLFVSPHVHSHGVGQAAWWKIEELYPEVHVWELVTPYFETRNIHFYVNKLGFHIVEFFNSRHPDPNDPDGYGGGDDGRNGMFRFEKVIRRYENDRLSHRFSARFICGSWFSPCRAGSPKHG